MVSFVNIDSSLYKDITLRINIKFLFTDLTSLSSVSGAVDAMACPPYTDFKIPKSKKSSIKYNSLLHKKLCK